MLPIAYLVALAAAQGAAWLASFVRFGDVSQGTWEFAFYTALDPMDIVYSVIKGMVLSFAVIVTALYYGYRVRGGPVEVGVATAQLDGGEPDHGHGPQHADDVHLLGVRPEPPDRMSGAAAQALASGPRSRGRAGALAVFAVVSLSSSPARTAPTR